MKKLLKNFLLLDVSVGLFGLLLSLVLSCQPQTQTSEKATVSIPTVTVLATDTNLSQQQDVILFRGKPFSGFVLEKYQDGKTASKAGYFNGKLEGVQQKWYPDGSKMELRFYAENRKVGKHTGWWENGQMKFEYFIEKDTPIGTHREWYPNGQLYSLSTYNNEGQPDGKQQMWFPTGQIKANFVMKDGRRFGLLGAKGCMGNNEKKTTGLSLKKEV